MNTPALIPYGDDDARAMRWQRRSLRLGSPHPICEVCGATDIRTLQRVPKKGGPASRILCANDRLRSRSLSAAALAKRRRDLAAAGYAAPTCFVCHEPDLSTLELQHISGRRNSGLAAPFCGNCHAIASDAQTDIPQWLLRVHPARRPLLAQAATDFGLAMLAGALAIDATESTPTIGWSLVALVLIGWAVWNLAADAEFARLFGPEYCATVPAAVPQ